MTTVERCRDCGRLFSYLPRGVCGECLTRREELFLTVKAHFRSAPGASVAEVATATGVPVGMITAWIADGRLAPAVPSDQALSEWRAEEDRLEGIRRALAETVAAEPPAVHPGPGAAAAPRRGMFGREH